MHGHRHGAAMLVPGYGPIGAKTLASLELNDSQSELLKSARAAGKDLRQARREAMKDAWKAKGQQLASGKIDPHQAVAQRRDAFRYAGQGIGRAAGWEREGR